MSFHADFRPTENWNDVPDDALTPAAAAPPPNTFYASRKRLVPSASQLTLQSQFDFGPALISLIEARLKKTPVNSLPVATQEASSTLERFLKLQRAIRDAVPSAATAESAAIGATLAKLLLWDACSAAEKEFIERTRITTLTKEQERDIFAEAQRILQL